MRVTQEPSLRRFWYALAFAEDLAQGPIQRRLLDTDLVLWQGDGGRVAAARDRCPHREATLSTGWTEAGAIVCPYHGWQFDTAGVCRLIPQAAPGQRPNPRAVLETFPCTTALGLVWVCLDPRPVGGIPVIPEFGAHGWRTIREFDTVWPCAAPHLLDNNIDLAHVSFVHRGTFGDPTMPQVDVGAVERTSYGMRARAGAAVNSRPGDVAATRRDSVSEVYAPFSGVLHIHYPDGLSHIIIKAISPIDDDSCRLLQFAIRNDTAAQRPDEDIISFDLAVAEEDRSVLRTVPADFPLELPALVHIDTDRASIAYRRMLMDIVKGSWFAEADHRGGDGRRTPAGG